MPPPRSSASARSATSASSPTGSPISTCPSSSAIFDEDLPQETPAEAVDLDPDDPAVIIFTSGTTGEPRGVVYPQRYLTGQRAPGRALGGRPGGRARLVHGRPRLGEVDPERLHRTLAAGGGGADPRRPLRSRRAARDRRARGSQRPLPGADRVPDARQADRAAADRVAASAGLRRRAAKPRGDPPVPQRDGAVDRRRLRPDRDRRGRPECGPTRTIPPGTGRWDGRCRGSRPV